MSLFNYNLSLPLPLMKWGPVLKMKMFFCCYLTAKYLFHSFDIHITNFVAAIIFKANIIGCHSSVAMLNTVIGGDLYSSVGAKTPTWPSRNPHQNP